MKWSRKRRDWSLPVCLSLSGVRRWAPFHALLCHKAADGEGANRCHHRRGPLLSEWRQTHQTANWLQTAGKIFTFNYLSLSLVAHSSFTRFVHIKILAVFLLLSLPHADVLSVVSSLKASLPLRLWCVSLRRARPVRRYRWRCWIVTRWLRSKTNY